MTSHRQFERLRPDVRIIRIGPDGFRLLDPVSGMHFDLRGKERYLLSLIDRCDDIREICQEYGQKFGQPLSEQQVLEFVEQLRVECLLVGSRGNPPPAADAIPHRSALFFHLRGEPANVFFDILTLFLGWIVHPIWLLVIVPLFGLEILLLANRWDQLLGDLERTLYEVPFLLLFLASYVQTVLLLNLPLALVMGICCRRYEGRVRSFGLTWGNWVLPTISFFTDNGDSILGMSRRGRRAMMAIGIFVPMTLGAIYALCWGMGSPANDGHKFWAFMVIPTAMMVVLQCNPFSLQSSAHWALASALDDWRLHGRALDETKAWFWGRTSPEPLSRQERWRLRLYGVAHFFLRFTTAAALLIGGTYFFVYMWGEIGAATMLLLALWWNRSYLAAFWRVCGTILIDLWELLTPARSR